MMTTHPIRQLTLSVTDLPWSLYSEIVKYAVSDDLIISEWMNSDNNLSLISQLQISEKDDSQDQDNSEIQQSIILEKHFCCIL